jgi:ATP-dependent Lon protease
MEQNTLKTFFLKRKIIFPYCTLTVFIRPSDETKEIKKGDQILAVTIRTILDLMRRGSRLATLAEVQEAEPGNDGMKIVLKGLARVTVTRITRYKFAEFEPLGLRATDPHDMVIESLRKKAQELIFLINVEESDKLIKLMNYIVDLNQMTDFIANYFVMDFPARFRLYKEIDIKKRSQMLTVELSELINRLTKKRNKKNL